MSRDLSSHPLASNIQGDCQCAMFALCQPSFLSLFDVTVLNSLSFTQTTSVGAGASVAERVRQSTLLSFGTLPNLHFVKLLQFFTLCI